jgi:hypothetical protein
LNNARTSAVCFGPATAVVTILDPEGPATSVIDDRSNVSLRSPAAVGKVSELERRAEISSWDDGGLVLGSTYVEPGDPSASGLVANLVPHLGHFNRFPIA